MATPPADPPARRTAPRGRGTRARPRRYRRRSVGGGSRREAGQGRCQRRPRPATSSSVRCSMRRAEAHRARDRQQRVADEPPASHELGAAARPPRGAAPRERRPGSTEARSTRRPRHQPRACAAGRTDAAAGDRRLQPRVRGDLSEDRPRRVHLVAMDRQGGPRRGADPRVRLARLGASVRAKRTTRERRHRHDHDQREEQRAPEAQARRYPRHQGYRRVSPTLGQCSAATMDRPRGYSSVGRAPGSHPGGRRFESG